ncbi:MAG: AraC family transcriptional regulator [bacterium]|nr:AraC family transcriptional regulator [bacterium]
MRIATNQLFLTPDRAIFVGPVQDNELHRHHALQMVVSPVPFRLAVGPGDVRAERFVLIDSDVPHAIQGDSARQILILIDRESTLAEALRTSLAPGDGFACLKPPEDLPDSMRGCAEARIESDRLIRSALQSADAAIGFQSPDERIKEACRFISEQEDFKVSLSMIANHIGLSEGRTTHLFKEQVGIPIRRFVMWVRVRRAIAEVARTGSLTEAAHAAGFADQAHFTRTFREMFGFAPKQILSRKNEIELHLCPQQ